MPRTARVVWPGYVYHVTQRGNNKQFIFNENKDYILYLKRAEEYRRKFKLDIFAYCLMGNHVHFIVRPHDRHSLARMFSGLHMRYAQYFQKKNNSSGHVWQGRFYSCLLSGEHGAAAIRYVERNPVRARIVSQAWQYSWSSARAHTGKIYKWITLADIREIMDVDDWKEYLMGQEDDDFLKKLRKATGKNLALGTESFMSKLEQTLGRRISSNRVGRPCNLTEGIERKGK